MKPKNFPGRVNQRRIRAVGRLGEQGGEDGVASTAEIPPPTPKQPGAALIVRGRRPTVSERPPVTGSRDTVAPVPATAPDETKAPPKPPNLRDFGLTDYSYERASRRFFDVTMVMVIIAPIVCVIAVFCGLSGRANGAVASLLVGIVVGLIFFVAIYGGESLARLLFDSDYKQLLRYRAAQRDFCEKEAAYERWLRLRQEEHWRGLSGIQFENELAQLFASMGYDVKITAATADKGVDLLLRRDGRLTIVQCKAHAKKIPISVARELRACLQDFKADDAIIACIEGVTNPVLDYIKEKPISVMDVRTIVSLQRQLDDPVVRVVGPV